MRLALPWCLKQNHRTRCRTRYRTRCCCLLRAGLLLAALAAQAEEKFRLMWPACSVSWVKGQRKDFFGQVGCGGGWVLSF